MPTNTDATALIVAGSCLAGGVLVGLVLRSLFGRLVRRAADTSMSWDDLGWALLRDLAFPALSIAGLWLAVEVLQPRPPVRGIADRILMAVIILAVAFAVAGLAGGMVRSIAIVRSGVAQSASIFVNITRLVVLIIGVLVLLQSLGVSITPMLTALGVGGLAVALALQDTLSDLFAGVHILASKKMQPGDFVRLDSGEDGYVVDVTWRNTTVRQLAGNIVVVPNARIAGAIVTNYHQPMQDLAVLVQVGVSYGSDLEHVERVTIEVATEVMTEVEGAVPDFEPFIRYHTFGDSSINFTVIMRAGEYVSKYLVTHEFIKRLHARYRAEGIEIPFPIRTVVTAGGGDGQVADRVPVPAARGADGSS
jgi:small-conductance mechanosensitive channel